MGYIASIEPIVQLRVISAGFEGSHFEFRVNQESYGFFSVIIGFLIHINQIGMDYLWDAIFKMAAIEINGLTFSPITQPF